MNTIHVADVGDGLCMALGTLSGSVIQIDAGGGNIQTALNGMQRIVGNLGCPNVFVLSHFHVDHYNGLLQASRTGGFHYRITEVFFPRIPEFTDRSTFADCLFAMNARVFGSETGIMEYDLLEAVSRLNKSRHAKWRSLSRGETININGSVFEVLWPPTKIEETKTLALIRRAIRDFERAMEADEETRRAYERIREENRLRPYLQGEGGITEETELQGERRQQDTPRRERLPEATEKANKSLKRAANHLSLALFEDNRLLFLGDTESYEIKQIVSDLKAKDRTFFYAFITPHHGTHWNRSLSQINCINSIASNGRRTTARMREEVKALSATSNATFVNGDIVLPKMDACVIKTSPIHLS